MTNEQRKAVEEEPGDKKMSTHRSRQTRGTQVTEQCYCKRFWGICKDGSNKF